MSVAGEERVVHCVKDLREAKRLTNDGKTIRIITGVLNGRIHPLEHVQMVWDTVVARSLVASSVVVLLIGIGRTTNPNASSRQLKAMRVTPLEAIS